MNMKAVLRSLLCMLLILTAFVNTGCAKGADEDADYKVYYLNKENTKIDEIVNILYSGAHHNWDNYETSWDFKSHPLI